MIIKQIPLKLLFFVGIMGVSLALSQPVGAVVGAPCESESGSPDNPLLTACDECLGEFCDDEIGECVQGNPFICPDFGENPGCWTTCENVVLEFEGAFFVEPRCTPNDAFCDGISGGSDSNQCRVGVCTDVPDFDPLNPSGCDYTLTPDVSTECRNCIPEGLATLENCGNGICEPDEGEGCETCSIDCRTPGYDGDCLVVPEDQSQLNGICIDPAGIVFPGPPYPSSGQFPGQICEDGNLCTDNVCGEANTPQVGQCVVTDKVCEPDADFCCPAGCAAPTGDSCLDAAGAPIPGCDPDCYVPEECVPTPSPTPPPVFAGCLQGSGGWGEKGGPGCDGFACSLNTAPSVPSHGLALALLASLSAAAFLTFRKRHG